MKEKVVGRLPSATARCMYTFVETLIALVVVYSRQNDCDFGLFVRIASIATLISFVKTIILGSPEADGDMDYGVLIVDDSDENGNVSLGISAEEDGYPNPDVIKRITMRVERANIDMPDYARHP